MRSENDSPSGRVHRRAFKKPMSDGVRAGSVTIAVRPSGRRPADLPAVGDTLEAYRWHRIRPGRPVEELGSFKITSVLDVVIREEWFQALAMEPQVVLAVAPSNPTRRERDDFARIWCGFDSWAALVQHARGKRKEIPAKGIRLTVIHWKRGAA